MLSFLAFYPYHIVPFTALLEEGILGNLKIDQKQTSAPRKLNEDPRMQS